MSSTPGRMTAGGGGGRRGFGPLVTRGRRLWWARRTPTAQRRIEGTVFAVKVSITQPESDDAGAHPNASWSSEPREHDVLLAGTPRAGRSTCRGCAHRYAVQVEYQNCVTPPKSFRRKASRAKLVIAKPAHGVEIRDEVWQISSVSLPTGLPIRSRVRPRPRWLQVHL